MTTRAEREARVLAALHLAPADLSDRERRFVSWLCEWDDYPMDAFVSLVERMRPLDSGRLEAEERSIAG